jgi:hypothetical protein
VSNTQKSKCTSRIQEGVKHQNKEGERFRPGAGRLSWPVIGGRPVSQLRVRRPKLSFLMTRLAAPRHQPQTSSSAYLEEVRILIRTSVSRIICFSNTVSSLVLPRACLVGCPRSHFLLRGRIVAKAHPLYTIIIAAAASYGVPSRLSGRRRNGSKFNEFEQELEAYLIHSPSNIRHQEVGSR